ncbi:hypothetical protein TNCV_272621 [Trichonephila clavipes]|nr:hypothetical protein TNCV_272621 [Trichonephila clavipes]
MDKVSSPKSKLTAAFLAKKKSETGNKVYAEIRVKSTYASAINFCAFSILKRYFGKLHPERTLENGSRGIE